MPVYQFASITAAQALAFNSSADELNFTGVTAAQVVVTGSTGNLTLSVDGRSVTFGPNFSPPLSDAFVTMGQLSFPDGSKLRVGTSGDDLLIGSPGRDQLLGGDGNDTLTSGGAGLLYGGAGDDFLRVGYGNASIDGGTGIDTLSYDGVTFAVTVSLFPSPTGPQVFSVENLIGTAFNDRLTGDGQDNSIVGGAGNDTVDGGFGADTLEGGAGADDLSGGVGDDIIRGGAGQDTLRGGDGADQFVFAQGGAAPTAPDTIGDWSSEDRIVTGAVLGAYQETTAPDSGRVYANSLIEAGARYVAVQTPTGVILYVDSAGDRGTAEDVILLSGRTLDDISAVNVGAIETLPTAPPAPAEPGPPAPALSLPPPPRPVANGGFFTSIIGNIDSAHLSSLLGLPIEEATSTVLRIGASAIGVMIGGVGLAYDRNDQLIGGTVTSIAYGDPGGFQAFAQGGQGVPAASFAQWVATDATQTAFAAILARNDAINGGGGSELIRGYAGDDALSGNGGGDTIYGGLGNDQIYALARPDPLAFIPTSGATYLRGDEGDDYVLGGAAFDDINGNQGNDTCAGGLGDDWVVGGKDNDLLFGDAGTDVVWGNLGNDTQDGGDGNDQVRGGQGDDTITGGAGDDFVSGDRGNDTIAGGAGADLFHGSQDAGMDRVIDFRVSDGDRVMLDPGTTYTMSQVGGDTVIDMGGGHQMVLVGVTLSSLPAGWIFGA